MNINRLNYENYFLLYVDGELSAADMQSVEDFVSKNRDLANELEMLLQTKLDAGTDIFFNDKSVLFRTTQTSINEINYEEQFLLFIDNELSEEEKNKTIAFVQQHPELNAAFDLLKQTKLPEEAISFPDKDLLYRKEPSKKPVIAIKWWKMAAAAVLTGLTLTIWNLLPNHQSGYPLVKNKQLTVPVLHTSKPRNETIVLPENNIAENANARTVTDINETKKRIRITDTEYRDARQVDAAKPVAQNHSPATTDKQKLMGETLAANDPDTHINTHTASVDEAPNLHPHPDQIIRTGNPSDPATETVHTQPAVYKELDTDDDRKSLYVGSVELNRDKLRGFFRKASSLFRSKIKTDEEKSDNGNTAATLK